MAVVAAVAAAIVGALHDTRRPHTVVRRPVIVVVARPIPGWTIRDRITRVVVGRHVVAAVAVTALLAAPALAQDNAGDAEALAAATRLYADAKLSHEADLALYCGAGFHLLAGVAAKAGSAEADTYEGLSRTFLARADKLLTDEGLDFEARSRLAEAVTLVANEEVVKATGKARYSKDDCIAAVPQNE